MNARVILGLYMNTGKENGDYYRILGLHWCSIRVILFHVGAHLKVKACIQEQLLDFDGAKKSRLEVARIRDALGAGDTHSGYV